MPNSYRYSIDYSDNPTQMCPSKIYFFTLYNIFSDGNISPESTNWADVKKHPRGTLFLLEGGEGQTGRAIMTRENIMALYRERYRRGPGPYEPRKMSDYDL